MGTGPVSHARRRVISRPSHRQDEGVGRPYLARGNISRRRQRDCHPPQFNSPRCGGAVNVKARERSQREELQVSPRIFNLQANRGIFALFQKKSPFTWDLFQFLFLCTVPKHPLAMQLPMPHAHPNPTFPHPAVNETMLSGT